MNDFLKDKELKNAEDILNAMSVEEAISSFSMIDEYIVKLLECSAEDFLSLNNHFKSYYKDSKKIAENATNILMAITDESLSSSFNNLKDIARDFARVSDIFTTNVENFDIGLKKTIHKIESIKIQNQNLWQNILSLKLLIANTFNNKYIEENTESFNIIDNEIEKIKNVFVELNSNIDNYINKTTEGYLFLTTIKQENYSHLQRLNDKIDVSFELYNKKNKEASHLYTALKEQTDRNAVNIASIITNLQYHDIIRQKIEHIRKIHKDLIEELGVFLEGDSDKAMIHNKIKTYIKIRDISGLQAAQLLHANNQYQNAINEISKNLEAIGNEMMVISSMCDNLVGKSEQSKSHYLNDIIDYLGAALQYNHKLSQLVENIHHQADILSLIVKEINDNYSEITTSNNLIIKILNQIGLSLREEQNKGIVQIFALFKDINNQEVQIKNSLDDLIGQIKN